MLLGFELPNHPNPNAETWAQVEALRSTIVKVRPYHLTRETLEVIDTDNLAVILRPNADEGVTFDVRARIAELSGALNLLLNRTNRIYLICDNEPNHQNNNARASADYWLRVRQVFEALAQEYPEVEYVSPPMAVAQNEAEWYASGRETIALFDFVGVHLYGTTDNSLVTYALQLASVFDKPLLADELGNTDLHLSPDNKAFAVAGYVKQAVDAGVHAATIFIAQRPTDDWLYCTLPTERLAQVAAVVPQEVSMPSKPTTLELDPIAPVRPGEAIRVRGTIAGIDGAYGALEVFANYPQRDASTNWGQSGKAVFVSNDGLFDHAVVLGPANAPFSEPLTGTLEIRSLELDPQALAHGGSWGEQPLFSFPFTILPAGSVPAPSPEVPNPVPTALPPAYDIMFQRAGDVINAAEAVGDVELAEIGRNIHRAIDRRKAGR